MGNHTAGAVDLFLTKNKRLVFSAIYFLTWAAFAAFLMDFIFFSQKVGMTNSQIGLMNAAIGLVGIAIQPLAGFICDFLRTTRKVIMVLMVFGILFSLIMPFAGESGSLPVVMAVVFGYTIFMCSYLSLLDNWVARECIGETTFHFGALRLWGSLSYAMVALVYGRLSMTAYLSYAYYFRAFFLFLALICIFLYKHETISDKSPKDSAGDKGKPMVKELFKSPEYMLLFLFAFLMGLALTSTGNFFTPLMLHRGGTNSLIGVAGSINAIIEIPFFLYSHKLTGRIGPRGLMLTGIVFNCIQIVGFAFFGSPAGLIVAYFMAAPYVSLYGTGFLYYVYSIAPPKTEVLAQTAIQAIAGGLAGMLGNLLGGIVIDHFGIDVMYRSALIIAFISLAIFLGTSLWLKMKRNDLKKTI